MSECQLTDKQFSQCCCSCRYLRKTYAHCTAVVDRGKDCCCSVQLGWACQPPEFDGRIYINWHQHGCGCEMFYSTNVFYYAWLRAANRYLAQQGDK